MKKSITILACLITITIMPLQNHVNAQSVFDYNGITYRIIKDADESSTFGTAAVTAKSEGFYEGVVTIPSGIKQSKDKYADAYKVVAIDDFAFKGSPTLTKVVLPMTIESIGAGAFEACGKLTQIEIPDGTPLTHLGESVFAYSGLKSIRFPEGLTELPRFTFRECRNLEKAILPNSLVKIGISAFIFCTSLKSIELPKKLREIDGSAFSYCGLQRIALPDRVVSIGISTFGMCFDLEEVTLSPYTTTIQGGAFNWCCHLSKINNLKSSIIIDQNAFNGCVYLPEYLKGKPEREWQNKDEKKYKEEGEKSCLESKKSVWKLEM